MKLEFDNNKILSLFRDVTKPLEIFVLDSPDKVTIKQGNNKYNIVKHKRVSRGSSIQ